MILQFQRVSIATLLLFFVLTCVVSAQDNTPEAVVARAAHNELATGDKHPFRYKLHKMDDGKITTKEIIETKDGDVARLIAIGDNPLPADAEAAEIQRLENLLAHPELQAHRRKREEADANRADEMIRLLPHAFVYRFLGMVQGPNGPCYRLDMQPNPDFDPPDHQAEVFHGMAGELWIDQKQERMVRFQAHLIYEVDFGWGIVGKLYKGGTILVEQKDVGDGHWEQSRLRLNLQGKILVFKSLTIHTDEEESDYSPVPANWTYEDAVRALLSEKY